MFVCELHKKIDVTISVLGACEGSATQGIYFFCSPFVILCMFFVCYFLF